MSKREISPARLIAEIERLRAQVQWLSRQIKVMQAMAGHPDASTGCRFVIKQGDYALHHLDSAPGRAATAPNCTDCEDLCPS